jgi:hypothetical protein
MRKPATRKLNPTSGKAGNKPSLPTIVRQFRDGVLDGEDPENWCYMVSAPLQGFLSATGVPCKLIEGHVHNNPHYWIELPCGKIIDATASQFRRPNGRAMPAVFIGERPTWYLPRQKTGTPTS